MKGYQPSCFVCVCNLQGDGAEGEWELLGAISIKPWLRHGGTGYYPSSACDDQMKLFEARRGVISDGRFTSPDVLQ